MPRSPPGLMVRMWSAIWRGAGVGADSETPGVGRGRRGGLGDVSGRRVELEGAVEIGPADPPGSPGADGGQASALDPGPHGRRVQLQLIADLGDGQPRIFSRCRRTGVRVGHSEPSSTENHDIEVCHI